MSSCPEILDAVRAEEHVVQLYGTAGSADKIFACARELSRSLESPI